MPELTLTDLTELERLTRASVRPDHKQFCVCVECMKASHASAVLIEKLDATLEELIELAKLAFKKPTMLPVGEKALELLLGLVSEEDGTVVFRVLDDGSRHCQARLVAGRGDDAMRAAVDCAKKLGLMTQRKDREDGST